MSYEFTKLGAVEALTEMPENANALVEVDGAIKRVPASAEGRLFIVNIVSRTETTSPLPDMYAHAWSLEIDKTFAEVLEAFRAGNRVECRESAEDGSITIYQPAGFGEMSCGFAVRMLAIDYVVLLNPDGTAMLITND